MMKEAITVWGCFMISCFAAGPTDSLLGFLKENRDPEVSMSQMKGLALSPYLGPARKEVLNREWKLRQRWMVEENVELLKGEEKVDGDLAAVILGARSDLGPQAFRVLLFGLRLVDGEWQVAPTEGSFANAGLGFDPKIRTRAQALERWMMDQRATGGVALLEKQKNRFIAKIKNLVPEKELREASPEQVLDHWMKAVSAQDFDKAQVWMGALNRDLIMTAEWTEMTKILRLGVENKDKRNVWCFLTDPRTVQIKVSEKMEEGEASILMLFMCPCETSQRAERIMAIRFSFEDEGSGWRLKLPGFFAGANLSVREQKNRHRETQNRGDDRMAKNAGAIFEEHFSARHHKDPETLIEEMLKALRKHSLLNFLQTLHRIDTGKVGQKKEIQRQLNQLGNLNEEKIEELLEGEIDEEERQRFEALLEVIEEQDRGLLEGDVRKLRSKKNRLYDDAVRAFENLDKLGEKSHLHLAKIHSQGDVAVAILKSEPKSGGEQIVYLPVWLYRQDGQWAYLTLGGPTLVDVIPPELKEAVDQLSKLQLETIKALKEDEVKDLVALISQVDLTGEIKPVEDAGERVSHWRSALREGHLNQFLSQSGLLVPPVTPRWIIEGVREKIDKEQNAVKEDVLLGVETRGRFSGVSLLVDLNNGQEIDCPLYIVAPTKKGPRVLLDVKLTVPANGGKRLINADTMAALLNQMERKDFEDLKALLEWHEKLAQPAWDRWHKEKEK